LARYSQVVDSERDLAGTSIALRIELVDIPAEHGVDDASRRNPFSSGVECFQNGAVSHHRDELGDMRDFVEAVGDVNRRHAMLVELANALEQ